MEKKIVHLTEWFTLSIPKNVSVGGLYLEFENQVLLLKSVDDRSLQIPVEDVMICHQTEDSVDTYDEAEAEAE